MIVRYHELARKEIVAATEYYGRIRRELGIEFLAELTTIVETINENPLLFEQVRPGVRCAPFNRFPYGVYYRSPGAYTVRIIVVRHHRRHPAYGMRRQ